jgi:hypothetical protein
VLLKLFQQKRAKRCFLVKRRPREERADPVDLGRRLGGGDTGPSNRRTGEKGYEVATEHDGLAKTQIVLMRNIYNQRR